MRYLFDIYIFRDIYYDITTRLQTCNTKRIFDPYMSFVGVLDSNKYKQLWSRSIISLASIADHIKFIITPDTLSLSGVNSAKTSHAEIIFKKSCFHEYTVDFNGVVPEGFEGPINEFEINQDDYLSSSYSFLVNSKHLATLFKNLDANDLNYICFKIYWAVSAPATMKFKLLIEIKTKKLIIKQYQTNYQPILKNSVDIANVYKQERYDTQDGINTINYIMIEQIIPKQFLDVIPSNTEDFKIDIKNEKILFSGYTKQVFKDRECLKQPMAVTITINLDELINSNLTSINSSKEPCRKSINFRLKEFKNFMNLISNLSETNDEMGNGDCFEIFFKNPGDPIIFEFQSNPHVLVQYIQITSEDIDGETSRARERPLALKSNVIQKVDLNLQPSTSPRVNLPPPRSINKMTVGRINDGRINADRIRSDRISPNRINSNRINSGLNSRHQNNRSPVQRTPEPHSQNIPSSAEVHDFVTYGREKTPEFPPSKRRNTNKPEKRTIINSADTDYSDSDPGENEKEMILGPTQLENRPKSIFE